MCRFAALAVLLTVTSLSAAGAQAPEPEAPLLLSGPWEFYPGEWLAPGDERWNSDLVRRVSLPDSWNRSSWEGKAAGSPEGRATYRLRLERSQDGVPWSLSWSLAGSAARIWVNGVETARVGALGLSEATEVPANAPQRIPLGFRPVAEILIQVSNYHHVDGGLWAPILAGPSAVLERQERGNRSWDLLEAGACILLGLVTFGIGLSQKTTHSLLWFGATCVFLGLRILFHGHFAVFNLFPDLDWQLFQKVRHETMYLGALSFLLLLDSLLPGSFPPWLLRTTVGVSLAGALVVAALPYRWYGDLLYPYTALIAVMFAYSVLVLWRHRRPSEEYQLPILLGLAVLVGGSAFEFVRVTLFLPLPEVMPATTLALVLFMGWGVSLQQLTLYRQVQILGDTKDTMLSIIAHDLRGPLHSASRYVNKHLVPDDVDLSAKKAAIPILAQTLDRSVALLENLLSWSLSQSGRLEVTPELVRIGQLFAEAAADLDKVRVGKGLHLAVEASDLDARADVATAVIVLRNLLSNAYKFSPPGSTVRVSFGVRGSLVEVRIADQGQGLTPEQLRRVLSLHEKVVTEGTAGEQGSGFGLFLCQEFLRRNGGRLRAESLVGQGSIFVAAFPRA